MIPTGFPESNLTLMPSPGTEDTTLPLVTHNDGTVTTSKWVLNQDELEEINRTGAVYFQVWAGRSSPPVLPHVFNPLGHIPKPSDDVTIEEQERRIASGVCPLCKCPAGFRVVKHVQITELHDWGGTVSARSTKFHVPYATCISCGVDICYQQPIEQARLKAVVELFEKHSGLKLQEGEDTGSFQHRIERELGMDRWAQILAIVQNELGDTGI